MQGLEDSIEWQSLPGKNRGAILNEARVPAGRCVAIPFEESVEKAAKSTFPYKTDVANLHGGIQFRETGFPQSMSVRTMVYCKLRAKDVIVGHR